MEIYWIQDGRKQGPQPVSEIVSMLEAGELDENTMAWQTGGEAWVPLKELQALSSYYIKPSIIEEDKPDQRDGFSRMEEKEFSPASVESKPVKVVLIPSPALRFWARMVDMLLILCLGVFPISLFNLPYNEFYLIMIWPLMIPYDALCMHFFGTTPGKAIMNIKVQTINEQRLPLGKSFIRAFFVYTVGLGFMAPIFIIIMPLFSWWMTRKNGIAPWDMMLGTVTYISDRIPFWRILLCAWLIMILLQLSMTAMLPWQNDMMQQLPAAMQEMIKQSSPN